ncbi:MAG: S1 RNA-binding domain-containing protein [Nitrospiraceae bacterium]
MVLEGVVTNVAAFGAFVDIGVHQDGLVHVSALANTFVKDPHSVVKPGQVVKVKVLDVDQKRQRISLTMRLTEPAGAALQPAAAAGAQRSGAPSAPRQSGAVPKPVGAMALALAKARAKQ